MSPIAICTAPHSTALILSCLCLGVPAWAGPLDGKTYILELTSNQNTSGYGEYLVPALAGALDRAGLRPGTGPGADVVVNIMPQSDVGQWVGTGAAREWLYTVDITVGISPESYVIPYEGTPVFGVRARLMTPNSDRTDELDCLTRLAVRTAVANYGKTGVLTTDGQSCLRK